jgi:hypothetical protein
MKRLTMPLGTMLSIALLLASFMLVHALTTPLDPATPSTDPTPLTTIVVDSATDPDDNQSRTCLTHTPCTLRRAIVQARNLHANQRPVLIAFNIPATAEHGYDAVQQLWKIQIYPTTQTSIFRRLNGDIRIDGTTQPGGRATGPKIIIYGPGTGQKDGLVVGDVGGNNNHIIRGLGFQNLDTHIYLNTDNNLIEQNWFGLNDAGTEPVLRGDNPQNGSGNAGIAFASGTAGGGADNNIVRHNRFLGLNGVALAIRGTDNLIHDNFIGTRADGQITSKATDPTLICTPVDWLGGSGVSMADADNIFRDNYLAGIRIQISQWSLQADAIRVSGQRQTVRDNLIGLDTASRQIGVCGRGIYLSDGPKNLRIENNLIIEPTLSGISLNGILYDGNTLRTNLIRKTGSWPQVEGSARPEDAIQVNPSLPDPFENFVPAQVTLIDGVQVAGTAVSPCPNCIIELFLDDNDAIAEALESLALVTANAQGNWTATLNAPLPAGHGIRTTTTTAQFNNIANMSAGTTSGLSVLYRAELQLFLPLITR